MNVSDLYTIRSNGEWLMAGYATMNAFFDESGKFLDRDVVCFGGVSSYSEHVDQFAKTWERLLFSNGLKEFSSKDAFRFSIPFSEKNPALGVTKRIEAIAPFIECIRKELLIVTGVAISVKAFRKLPPHTFQFYGSDPINVAFARAMLHVCEFTPPNDKLVSSVTKKRGKQKLSLKVTARLNSAGQRLEKS